MNLDVVDLSRLQFALTVMFHYLFPPLTIGMGVVLVYLEGMFLRTKQPIYESAARFWTQLFAVTFAIGVATGIVMEFQFGANWSVYSRFVGDAFGSALAAEGIFAFFLESGFLAVLIFGWDKVSPRLHFIATVCVAMGSIFSAIWIVVANSWQQTPAGHHIVQMMREPMLPGRAVAAGCVRPPVENRQASARPQHPAHLGRQRRWWLHLMEDESGPNEVHGAIRQANRRQLSLHHAHMGGRVPCS